MSQNTNLNIAPYFDDFDSSKGFLKVLFKPGYPVQARELTTLQSLLQNQIDSFGQGVYKEGAQVIPGGITLNKDVACVIIQNNYLNLDVELYRTQLNDLVLKGSTSGVRARVLFSISSTTSTRNNITFYINYLQKADDNVTTTFTDGETLTCETDITYSTTTIASGTPIAQLLNANANSKGSTANVGAGVYYVRGYFAPVTEQTLILDQYATNPTYKVGLKVEEKIITADEDETLYDNAIGSTNFSAPGADRFKINLTLVKKNLADPNSADFIELLRTNTGEIEKKVERSDLGFINEVLANRTKEESGDYYVKKFEIDARENLDDGFNNGVYTAGATTSDGNTASEANISVQLSNGAAYISGFRTERLSTTYKDVEKPRTFVGENNKYISTDIGNYVFMTNLHKAPSIYEVINLRDAVTDSLGTGAGTIIGQTRVLNFAYESGTVNNQSTVYRTNLVDTKFFTKLNCQASEVWSLGDFVVGKTSGATGFVAIAATSTAGYLSDVVGTFVQNEELTLNVASGSAFAQLDNNANAVKSFNFTDVKSYSFGTTINSTIGTADAVLDVKVALPGSGPIVTTQSGSGTSQTATVTATLSNFNVQLKVGDIVEFTNNNIAHKVKVTAVTDAFNFNVQKVEAGAGNMTVSAITGQIVRSRPEIKEAQKNKLLSYIGYDALKNTNKNNTQTPSGSFRKYFAGGAASGGALGFNAGSGLVFTNSNNNDTFLLINNTNGDILQAPTTDVSSGQTVNITGLSGSNNYSLIATVNASDRTAKGKTTERMKILKIDKSVVTGVNGLTQANSAGDGYGYRVDDAKISLGCGDVFNIKAIYEANGTAADVNSTIPNVEFANLIGTLSTDEVVTGDASGARGRIVAIGGTNNRMYFIPVEDDKFTDGETITAPNATFKLDPGTLLLGGKDITDSFTLDNGQRDQFYDYSSIVRKTGYAAPTHQILIIFDRFLTTNGISPYTVDSYTTADYKIIPNYDGQELRDVIDFRPIVPEKLANTGGIGSPFTLNGTEFFDFGSRAFTGNLIGVPGPGETTIISLEHYLARVDKVFMNKDNVVQVVKGAPGTNPVEPEDIEDAMLLATVNYKPYVFDVEKDVSLRETNFKRYTFRDIQVLEDRIKTLEFYTQLSLLEGETASMEIRDTSGLSRFKNGFVVDNFASLATSDTLHQDYRVSLDFEEGQMRPAHYTTQVPLTFSTASTNVQQTGDLVTLPYVDTVLLDQPYSSGVENVNPFNVFTYVGDIELYPEKDNWVDTKTINPVKGPVVEGNFLTTVREFNADQNGFSPVQWNSWKTTWTGSSTTTKVGSWRRVSKRRRDRTITTTKTTTSKQTRTGIRYRVTPVIEQKSLGNKVVSVEHIQFMRSRNLEFDCQKLKPRTKFFAFFDGITLPKKLITPKIIGVTKDSSTDPKTNSIPFQVGETVHCVKGKNKVTTQGTKGFRFKARVSAPNEGYEINPLDGSDIQSTNDYTSNLGFINIDTKSLADQAKGTYYGSPKINDYIIGETSGAIAKVTNKDLITDKKGKLKGSFFIDSPKDNGNLKFKTGSKLFRLTDDASDSKVIGISDSSAEVEFTASGILQTMQDQIISVRNAKVTSEDMFDSRTVKSSSSTSVDETRFCDPLAQTFLIEDSSLEGGVFLTKIDIFFITKDAEIPVSLDIRTVENGNPTQRIVPLSKVIKEPADVFTSTDASSPTSFVFKSPVYLPFRQEHAVVLTSDSNQYKVFISILGQDAIDAAHAGEKISEQPYIGVLFKSQNASTWTPSQYEDLMFKIFRADFTLPSTASNSKLVLENAQLGESNGGFLNLAANSMQMTAGSDEIRVFHGNHGMQSSLNYVQIDGVSSEVPDTTLTSAIATSGTNTFTVASGALLHTNMSGSAISNSNPGFLRILGDAEDGSGDEIIAYSGISTDTITIATNGRSHTGSAGGTTGKAFVSGAIVQCYNLNGIPLTSINATHTAPGGIISLKSPHSYNLKVTGKTANTSMMGGGVFMSASQNIPWDVLTPQILNQTQPKTSIIPRVLGTSGTSCGPDSDGGTSGLETSFVKDTTYLDVVIGEENYFPQTKIIANQLNEINRMNNVKSFTMELDLESEVTHLSPVVDLSAVSIITTANVVNNIEPSADIGSECAANYITKVARMDKSATGLKVMLAANTFTQSTIRVMYKLVPVGFVGNLDDLPFQFFNTTGIPDSGIMTPQNDLFTFTDYEYTIDDSEDFDGFQIKVSLLAYDQPYIPRVKDLRAIALA